MVKGTWKLYLSSLRSPLSHELPLRLCIFRLPGPFCRALSARLNTLPLAP